MVDWGVVYGWINTGLLGVLGICVLVTGRWKHLKWLPVYALVTTALSVFQLSWLYAPEFSLAKRLVCELLFLGAIVEVVYKEAKKTPFWPWCALLSIVIVPFLPIDPVLKYYLPQEIFVVGVALELSTAVQKKIAPLLGWSVLAAATVVSDILKFTSPSEVMQVLRFVDPLVYMGSMLIILGGLYWPEIERWILPFFRLLNMSMWKTVAVESKAKVEPRAERAAVDSSTAYDLPLPLRVVKPEDISSDNEIWELRERTEALEDKLCIIEESMRNLVSLGIRPVMRRHLLSIIDVAIYLGTNEETARHFIKQHNIPTIPIDDEDDWRVFRTDIDAALEDED